MAKADTWEMMKEYFSPDEFGDGAEAGMQDDYLIALYKFRVAVDNPMIIHHNGGFATTGHSDKSYHYQGRAIDFHFRHNPMSLRRIVVAAIKSGLHGIGIYPYWEPKPGGFHLDNRHGSRANVWHRDKNGIYRYMWTEYIPESLEEWIK